MDDVNSAVDRSHIQNCGGLYTVVLISLQFRIMTFSCPKASRESTWEHYMPRSFPCLFKNGSSG